MHRPDHSCFGPRTHADAERRLVFFGGLESGFGRSGGGSEAARERLFRDYEANIRAKAEIEKSGTSRDYQRFVDRETEREIREARARVNRGETMYKIRNASDAHFIAAQLTHRINGDVQDPYMDNAWDTTAAGKKAERDRRTKELHAYADARTDAMLSEYRRSMETGVPPLWQTQYFLEEKMPSRQAMIKQWVEEGGMNVPSQVLAVHGLRLNDNVVERIDGMPMRGEFVRRSPNAPRNPDAQPGSPVARQALAFPDVSAGLPQKISRRDAQQPGFPIHLYESDPYGELKLSPSKVLRANTEQELAIRKQRFEQQLVAARLRMQKAFDALQAKVDYAMGPERADLLKLQSDMQELVTAAEQNTPQWAEFLAKQATDGTLNPGDAQILARYPADMRPDMARQLYLSQKLPTSLESIAVRCEAELKKREMLVFNQTQDLHVDFMTKYFVAKGMLEDGGRTTQVQRETAVMSALAALNAYGSHVFRNYRGTITDEATRKKFFDASLENATTRGLHRPGNQIVDAMIPADDEGIPKLLQMRSDLLEALTFWDGKSPEPEPLATSTKEWCLQAARAERAYIEKHKNDPGTKVDAERLPQLTGRVEAYEFELELQLESETDQLAKDGAPPATVIAAANKELAFRSSITPTDKTRTARLSAREPDGSLGIIAAQYELLHKPLRDATNEIAEPKTPVEFRQRLQAIKAEGRFLHRYVDQMARSAEPRLAELLRMQEGDTLGLIDATFSSLDRNDPVALANAVADIYSAYVRPIEAVDKSKPTAVAARAKLEPIALELRALVNPLVANTRKSAEADASANVAAIDGALAAINAESDALEALKLDPARVAALKDDMKLLDARVAVRQAVEQKLDVKTDSTPTVANFRKAYELLRGEEKAIRLLYAKDPLAMKARLDEIAKRRGDYRGAIHTAADAAIARLGDASETEDAAEAEELLRLSLRVRLGETNENVPLMELAKRLPTSAEYSAAEYSKQRIDDIRAAIAARPRPEIAAPTKTDLPAPNQANKDIVSPTSDVAAGVSPSKVPRAEMPRDTAMPVQPAPASLPRRMPSEVAGAGTPIGVLQPATSAQTEIAPVSLSKALRGTREAEKSATAEAKLPDRKQVETFVKDALFSIRENDAYLTGLEQKNRNNEAVDERAVAQELEARMDALLMKERDMESLRRRLVDAKNEGDAYPIHQFYDVYLAAREGLDKRLQYANERIGTAESVAKASLILFTRFKQFETEMMVNARQALDHEDVGPGSGVDGAELYAEIMGDGTFENPGLLSKAVTLNVDQKIVTDLREAEKFLRPFSARP